MPNISIKITWLIPSISFCYMFELKYWIYLHIMGNWIFYQVACIILDLILDQNDMLLQPHLIAYY